MQVALHNAARALEGMPSVGRPRRQCRPAREFDGNAEGSDL